MNESSSFRTNVDELETKQKEKIAEVLKIRRFKEALERLREQAKKKFIEEQEKLEQKQLDEMATLSFAREMPTAEKAEDKEGVQSMDLTAGLQENKK